MLAEAVVGRVKDKFVPTIITRGQFGTFINLDEDGPRKVFSLMAPITWSTALQCKELLCASRSILEGGFGDRITL